MGDQGSDINLTKTIFRYLQEAVLSLQLKELSPPERYEGISKDSDPILCTHEITLDIQLRIRHGTKLLSRFMVWKLGEAATDEVIIGREVLQSIGCDNRAILAAACGRNDGIINIPDAVSEDEKKSQAQNVGIIGPLKHNGVFHSNASEGDDGLDESRVYIDLGDDEPEVID
eukprot:GFKZ01016009.1.p3 GENE.GFKZ01016009.1~~GFKZ01016009.1.p3  ORF type:complete len:172 (-),score=27.08 GFKZ01016009.1:3459-3974(-)